MRASSDSKIGSESASRRPRPGKPSTLFEKLHRTRTPLTRRGPPLVREDRVDELTLPFLLHPLVLDEMCLAPHPELLEHAGRCVVARLEPPDHPVQPDAVERDREQRTR